jgi:uncharacterized protein (UPF0548 family)
VGWSRYSNIFGKFTLGTLLSHVERAEERFTVEEHEADDPVFYDVFAFARSAHHWSRWADRSCGIIQRRFAANSLRSMAEAVEGGGNL